MEQRYSLRKIGSRLSKVLTVSALLATYSLNQPALAGGYPNQGQPYDGGINLLNGKALTEAEARELVIKNQIDVRIDDLNDFYQAQEWWRSNLNSGIPITYDLEGRLTAAERRTGLTRSREGANVFTNPKTVLPPADAAPPESVPEPSMIGALVLTGLLVGVRTRKIER